MDKNRDEEERKRSEFDAKLEKMGYIVAATKTNQSMASPISPPR
jgi:hypothetical protein